MRRKRFVCCPAFRGGDQIRDMIEVLALGGWPKLIRMAIPRDAGLSPWRRQIRIMVLELSARRFSPGKERVKHGAAEG